MILYLDASALVKRYVAERGSAETNTAIQRAEVAGTALISRAEVVAALAKAVRLGVLIEAEGQASLRAFRGEWLDLVRVQITELAMARADGLAWDHGLRGYDAVHLAAALLWQDAMGERIAFATFDRQLWMAARGENLEAFPADLPALLAAWKSTLASDQQSS